MHECIGGRFRRPEPRRRVLEYLNGRLGPVERKNGWPLAERAGDATPDGVQHPLYNYRWDADLFRDDPRRHVVEYLADTAAVLVVDETGFRKNGNKPVGCTAGIAARQGESTTVRSAYSWPALVPGGGDPAGPGNVPAPGVG